MMRNSMAAKMNARAAAAIERGEKEGKDIMMVCETKRQGRAKNAMRDVVLNLSKGGKSSARDGTGTSLCVSEHFLHP